MAKTTIKTRLLAVFTFFPRLVFGWLGSREPRLLLFGLPAILFASTALVATIAGTRGIQLQYGKAINELLFARTII